VVVLEFGVMLTRLWKGDGHAGNASLCLFATGSPMVLTQDPSADDCPDGVRGGEQKDDSERKHRITVEISK